jgi:peroxiredoxin
MINCVLKIVTMKRGSLAFLLIVPIIAFSQKKSSFKYELVGKIEQMQDPVQILVLSYYLDDHRIFDTAKLENGRYRFSGELSEPVRSTLRVVVDTAAARDKGIVRRPIMQRDLLTVFLDAGKIEVVTVDSFSNSKVRGSKIQDEYAKLATTLKPLNDENEKISKEYAGYYRAKDEEGMKKLEPKFDEIDKQIRQIQGDYVKANPQSPYAIFALNDFAGYDIDAATVEPLFKTLPQQVQASSAGVTLSKKIAIAKKTGVGMYALDFTQNDTANVPVSLSSFRGKYVLVDFWASWCGPCRAENPNVVKAFHKYKDKGFTIIGVSLDRPGQKEKWINAIHDDRLSWTHVSDLMFWENAVAKLYGIQAIPQNYLLDPTGKIIAKGVRGEELEKKLSEVLQ